jgi:c-di-GMP-binding flagellar brake protein YcgR
MIYRSALEQKTGSLALQSVLHLDNRRRATRVNRQLEVSYCVPDAAPARGLALNVSQSGARVLLRGDGSHSREMTLRFDGNVTLLARTVWERPINANCRIAGVRFEAVDEQDRQALTGLLYRLSR